MEEKNHGRPRSLEVISGIKQYSDFCMTSDKKDKFSENLLYFWIWDIKISAIFI